MKKQDLIEIGMLIAIVMVGYCLICLAAIADQTLRQ